MLGAPCLSPCSQHWRAGSGVASIQRAGKQVAVSLADQGGTLLFSEQDLGKPVADVPGSELGNALACTRDGAVLLLGGGPAEAPLQRVTLAPGQNPLPEALSLGAGLEDAPVACIARQEGADIFAVARGRLVHVLDREGQELRRLGPLPQPVQQLAWAGSAGDTLVAATPAALHTWTQGGVSKAAVLPSPSPAAAYLRMASSPQAPLLAASSVNKEVLCWNLATVLGTEGGCEPLRLREFESQVACLEWDPTGQFLATADGADCAVWDLADASGAQRSCSTVCCGHEPRTRITRMSFQPDGPLLATASSSGKVALFDCQLIRRGGVLGPVAFTRLDQVADPVTALLWLPGGRLAVGAASGRLVCLQLVQWAGDGQQAQLQEVAAPAGNTEHVHVAGQGVAPETPAAAVAAAPVPLQPPPAAAVAAAAPPAVAGVPSAATGAMAAATAAAAAAMSRSGSRPLQEQAAAPSTLLSPGGQDGTAVQYEAGGQLMPSMGNPATASRQGSTSSGSSGQPRRSRGARGGANRGGAAAAAAAAAAAEGMPGAASGNAGFSASLMHHIQAIRENPGSGVRPDQQQQLAGWGLGSPSGAHVPWMMGGGPAPGGGGQMPAGAATYAQHPYAAQFQAQAAMMQRMGMPQQGPPNMAYMPQPSSPQAAYQHPQQQQQQQMFVAAAAGMSPQQQQVMAPQQMMVGQWMPYMQQMQQWAGTAPGYMMYQHPQYAAATATLHTAAVRHNGGGGGGSGGSGGPPSVASSGAASGGNNGGNGFAPASGMSGGMGHMGSGNSNGSMYASGSSGAAGGNGNSGAAMGGAGGSNGSGGGPALGGGYQYQRTGSSGGNGRHVSQELEAADRDSNNMAGSPRSRSSSRFGGGSARGSSSGHGSSGRVSLDRVADAAAAAANAVNSLPDATGRSNAGGGGSGAGINQLASSPHSSNHGNEGAALLRQLQQQRPGTLLGLPPAAALSAAGPSRGMATAAALATQRRQQQQQEEQDNDEASQQQQQEEEEQQEENENDGEGDQQQPVASAPADADSAAPKRRQRQAAQQPGASPTDADVSSALEVFAAVDLNNNDLNNKVLSGSETSSQADTTGGDAVNTVYVGNLPGTVDEYMLLCAFAPFGPITHVQVIKEKGSQLSRGYAFISYAHPIYATVAMQHMNQQVLFGPFSGQRIKVAPSKRH